jgi:thioredoxin reductase (NADPH)
MEVDLQNVSEGTSKTNTERVKVLVLGSGPAGLSAALYAARAELCPVVITGMDMGGQAATTFSIENYPGFPEGVGGQQLGELFQKQAERFGARLEFDVVTSVDLSKRPFKVATYNKEFPADTLIVSTGASPNHLDIPGENEYTGHGVSYCATCDGWFFKEKRLVVVGGGDSALEEALFLTRYASSVTIIHRRDTLRAGAILQNRAKENPKVNFIWDTVVTSVNGNGVVKSVSLKNVKTGETSELPVEGVFIFVGHTPNTSLFKGQLELDENGYVVTDVLTRTSVPGVYAGGEASDPHFRQVVTSAGMGAAAAIQATHYLEDNEK